MRIRYRRSLLVALFLLLLAPAAWAQIPVGQIAPDACGTNTAGICGIPRVTSLTLTTTAALRFNWNDGAGNDLSYGGGGMYFTEDGKHLYYACGVQKGGIAKLNVPASGTGVMTPAAPCKPPFVADIMKIIPGWGAGQPSIGGVVEHGGRVAVGVYGSYDANGVAQSSHFTGASLDALTGPWLGAVAPGLVKGAMGVVPANLRPYIGGPVFAMSGYTSIIHRQSTGAAVTTFDLANASSNNFPMKMVLGCPYALGSCGARWTAWGQSTTGFQGSELSGGGFFVPNTRTFVAIEREGRGYPAPGTTGPNMEGYGYPSQNPADHGKPYLDARLIYATDPPNSGKGNKSHGYYLAAKLYDAKEMADAYAGLRTVDTIQPYAVFEVPTPNGIYGINSGAYNPVTDQYCWATGGGGQNDYTLDCATGWKSVAPPPPPKPTGTLTVRPDTIAEGDNATISWSFSGHTNTPMLLPDGTPLAAASGSLSVSPTASTTYTVDLTNAGGTTSLSALLTVTPKPVDCAGTWRGWQRVAGSETACVGGKRSYTEDDVFTIVTPPSNGGAACPASPVTRAQQEDCAVQFPMACTSIALPNNGGTEVTCTATAGAVSTFKVVIPPQQQ